MISQCNQLFDVKSSEICKKTYLRIAKAVYSHLFTDIQVSCYAYEGVDAVKNALRAGLSLSTEEMPIKVS